MHLLSAITLIAGLGWLIAVTLPWSMPLALLAAAVWRSS